MTAVRDSARDSGSVTTAPAAVAPSLQSVLRLRSTAPRPAIQFLTLRDLSRRQDVLRALVQLQSLAGELSEDDAREATRRLFLLLNTLDDTIVKEKSVDLLGRLACGASSTDAAQIALTLVGCLQKVEEEAPPVICQVLLSLCAICQHWINDELCHEVVLECVPIVAQLLPTSTANVRRAALHLVVAMAPVEQRLQSATAASGLSSVAAAPTADIHRHCAAGINDDEPRVRAAALQGLISMNDQGMPLQLNVYRQLASVLLDDYADVRSEAMQLVWRYCQAFPDKLVSVGDDSGVEQPLLDDGFVKICDMMNDLAMPVRWKAASLLGSLHNVSFKFLQQTLDKKLMSHLRAKRSEHDKLRERYRANMTISEWESGRKWSDGPIKKQKDLDPSDVPLISNGACGAFVHGLEDEFLEVRKASVESMSSLAVHRPRFAALSVDYLVDMLNDEIQTVRLAAMEALQQIMTHLELRDDQLETFLSGLSDSSAVARGAVRDLLTVVQLSSSAMLQSCLKSLQTNLSRYPADRSAIFQCMATLGSRHSNLVMAAAPSLLNTDPMFATPEPDIELPSYIANLILIFNALPHCPTIKGTFPTFMAAHYAFLASSSPHLVPELEYSGNRFIVTPKVSRTRAKREEAIEGKAFVEQSVRRALTQNTGSSRLQFIKLTLSDMHRLAQLNSPISCLASWSCLYLHACSLLENAIHHKSTDVVSWNNNQAARVLSLSYQAEHLYIGLTPAEQLAVAELRVMTHALQLLHRSSLAREDIKVLLKRVGKLDKRCQVFGLQAGPCLQSLLMQGHVLERGKMSAVLQCLQDATQAWHPAMILPDSSVLRTISVAVDQPSNPDHIHQFSTSLATSLPVAMTLSNVADVRKVVLQVLFPDQSRHLVHASPSNVSPEPGAGSAGAAASSSSSSSSSSVGVRVNACSGSSSGSSCGASNADGNQRQRVSMEPVISHHVWSESSHIEVSAVLSFVADQDEIALLSGASSSSSSSVAVASSGNGSKTGTPAGAVPGGGLPPLTPAVAEEHGLVAAAAAAGCSAAGAGAGGGGTVSATVAADPASSELLLSHSELSILTHHLLPLSNSVRYCVHPKERIYTL